MLHCLSSSESFHYSPTCISLSSHTPRTWADSNASHEGRLAKLSEFIYFSFRSWLVHHECDLRPSPARHDPACPAPVTSAEKTSEDQRAPRASQLAIASWPAQRATQTKTPACSFLLWIKTTSMLFHFFLFLSSKCLSPPAVA